MIKKFSRVSFPGNYFSFSLIVKQIFDIYDLHTNQRKIDKEKRREGKNAFANIGTVDSSRRKNLDETAHERDLRKFREI